MPTRCRRPVRLLLWLLLPPCAALAQVGQAPADSEAEQCRDTVEVRPQEGLETAGRLLAQAGGDDGLRLRALECRLIAEMVLARKREADATLEAMRPLLDRDAIPLKLRFDALFTVGQALNLTGRPRQAMALFDQALELADAQGSSLARINALLLLASVHAEGLRDPAAALPYYEQAIAQVSAFGRPPLLPDSVTHLQYGRALLDLGHLDEARAQIGRAREIARSLPNTEGVLAWIQGAEGRLALAAGDLPGARREIEASLRALRGIGDSVGTITSELLLARLERTEGRLDPALAAAQRAVAQAEQGGFVLQHVDALEELARIERARDRPGEAAELARRAHALERERLSEQDAARAALKADPAPGSAARTIADNRQRLLRDAGLLLGGAIALAGLAALWQRRRRRAAPALLDRAALVEAGRAMAAALSEDRHALLIVGGDASGDAHRALASLLRRACDPSDLVAEWDGTRLAILRAHTRPAPAFALAAHVASVLAQDARSAPLAIAVGVAPLNPDAAGGDEARLAEFAWRVARRADAQAWAGLWPCPGADTAAVLQDPRAAQARGLVLLDGQPAPDWRPD